MGNSDALLAVTAMATAFGVSIPDMLEIDKATTKGLEIRGRRVAVRTDLKIGRNAICPKCDSGKKYKKCCGGW